MKINCRNRNNTACLRVNEWQDMASPLSVHGHVTVTRLQASRPTPYLSAPPQENFDF